MLKKTPSKLPVKPDSAGRYKDYDVSGFDEKDMAFFDKFNNVLMHS